MRLGAGSEGAACRRPKIGYGRRPAPDWLLDHGELNSQALGPGAALEAEWLAAGLELPDRAAIRRYRLGRVREQLRLAYCDGALMCDPVNIRYATDTTNMSLWTMHNPARFAFVGVDGRVVVWEFSDGEFLNTHSEVVDEIRPAPAYCYFFAGDREEEQAARWAAEVADVVHESARPGTGMRLAVDQFSFLVLEALQRSGVCLVDADAMMERARLIKCDEEIKAMRCAVHACEAAISDMRAAFVPGITEMALWAQLWAGSLSRYGEWIETRLLSSGPRTNPWYHEASSRVIQDGDLMGFDTDMVGAYGACVDMSRTWLCGDGRPSGDQRHVYDLAREQVERNIELHRPGVSLRELTERAWYPPAEEYNYYTVISHGVGLCDEYPSVYAREKYERIGYDDVLQPGMVMCVEAFVGKIGGREGVKLEEQVLITETGPEVLTQYPLDLT